MELSINNTQATLPDFFIVGAPKCGTTSLYYYLNEHPQVFLPDVKEPRFFNFMNQKPEFEGPGYKEEVITEIGDYISLYENADENSMAGDASPSYLYDYKNTIENIKKVYKDEYKKLKIIIILRNPIDRAWSHYLHLVKFHKEPLPFEKAIKNHVIENRINNDWTFFYDYIGFGQYFDQVMAYKKEFPNVLLLTYDEFRKDSRKTLRDIYLFLKVNSNHQPENINVSYNVSGKPKNGIAKLSSKLFFGDNYIKRIIGLFVPQKFKSKFQSRVSSVIFEREKLPNNLRLKLIPYFRKDIELLNDRTEINVKHWLN